MSSMLKFEKVISKIGEPIHIFALNTNRDGTAIWSGSAKEEKLYWWYKYGVPVHIKAHLFNQHKHKFDVPGARIQAIGIQKNVYINRKLIASAKSVKLITRAPLSSYEARIHKRWPLVFYPRNERDPYIFNRVDEGNHMGQTRMF